MKSNLLSFILILTFSFPLFAAESTPASEPSDLPPPKFDLYLQRVDKKFDEGAINFVVGWTEIIRVPKDRFQNSEGKNRFLQASSGLGLGVIQAVADTVGGFGNALFSLTPDWKIPLPQDGIQVSKLTGGHSEI